MTARERLIESDAISRLQARDATLFSDDTAVQAAVADRLGWLDPAGDGSGASEVARDVADYANTEGITDVVLLGMGGSSLASLVIAEVLGAGTRTLHVLDSVAPLTVQRVLEQTEAASTLVLVSSKSGGTTEPLSLYAIFRARAEAQLGDAAGSRFVAITDPGTPLETVAAEAGFARIVHSPADVGGRFSALTVFGLVPAALVGADVETMLDRAATAARACAASIEENPAAELAAFIADARDDGADKLTLVARPELRVFGLWVEQLVAESLGKHGIGVVPVVELTDEPSGLGADRALVVLRMSGDARMAEWASEQRGKRPVYEIVLDDACDIAEEFVRWEYAVALVGHLMGIDPFDQPNVAEAKKATETVLLRGTVRVPGFEVDGVAYDFAGGLSGPAHAENNVAAVVGHALAARESGDYLALLAYLPADDSLLAPLSAAASAIAAETSTAVCLELGPRYLHSTGQLHKGGPNSGIFVLVTTRDAADVSVPGRPWTLGALHRAQALGDLETLVAHGRRVLWLDLPDASGESIGALAEALLDGAGVVHEVLRARPL